MFCEKGIEFIDSVYGYGIAKQMLQRDFSLRFKYFQCT